MFDQPVQGSDFSNGEKMMTEATHDTATKVGMALRPAPDVPLAELEGRLSRVRREMERSQLDAIVLTDIKNVQYVTDFFTLSWMYKARPVFALLTADDLIVIGSKTEQKNVSYKPRTFKAVYYHGYLSEGLAALSETIQAHFSGRTVRLGIDYGQDMTGLGSLEMIATLSGLSAGGKVTDATPELWKVRLIKSDFEANLKKTAFAIVNDAFDRTIADAYLGMTEIELYRRMQAQMFLNGAERADPIAMLFAKGDFVYSRPPSERRLEEGHYIWTDFRATYGGYPADRNRTARGGQPSDWEIKTYSAVRELTHTLCRFVKAGMTCSDVYANFARMWKELDVGQVYTAVTRIGHGGGFDVTEPPSLSATDTTVIEPGMIFHIEPKLERDGAVFQFEEVVYVRESGIEFLSDLSPAAIPVIS
ncbi:Xaa-Pro dipeptidase [Paraburkholderia sp. JPY465]|uniref:M24 family metallopeptidase n=1 Tax=Paraburkholderia sp. JPY465 TaxID=3042285 RepID=UPI003D1AFDD7